MDAVKAIFIWTLIIVSYSTSVIVVVTAIILKHVFSASWLNIEDTKLGIHANLYSRWIESARQKLKSSIERYCFHAERSVGAEIFGILLCRFLAIETPSRPPLIQCQSDHGENRQIAVLPLLEKTERNFKQEFRKRNTSESTAKKVKFKSPLISVKIVDVSEDSYSDDMEIEKIESLFWQQSFHLPHTTNLEAW